MNSYTLQYRHRYSMVGVGVGFPAGRRKLQHTFFAKSYCVLGQTLTLLTSSQPRNFNIGQILLCRTIGNFVRFAPRRQRATYGTVPLTSRPLSGRGAGGRSKAKLGPHSYMKVAELKRQGGAAAGCSGRGPSSRATWRGCGCGSMRRS